MPARTASGSMGCSQKATGPLPSGTPPVMADQVWGPTSRRLRREGRQWDQAQRRVRHCAGDRQCPPVPRCLHLQGPGRPRT